MNSSEFLLDLKHFFNSFEKSYIQKYPDLFAALKNDKKNFFNTKLLSKFNIEIALQLEKIAATDEKITFLANEYADFRGLKEHIENFVTSGLTTYKHEDTYTNDDIFPLMTGYEKEMMNICDKCLVFLEKSIRELEAKNINIKQEKIIPLKSFESTLSDEQLKKLYGALINSNFIDGSITSKNYLKNFKAIFNAEAIQNIKPVKWIDKPEKKQSIINLSTLFELLYLLKEKYLSGDNFDTNQHNRNNLYRKIENCFITSTGEKIKNIRNRNTFKILGNTERKRILFSLVNSLGQNKSI